MAYVSVRDLLKQKLREHGYIAVCAPYYNSLLKRLDYLNCIVRGERPEGRPLSLERETARYLISSGWNYEAVLWVLKSLAEQPLAMEHSPDYSFGGKHKITLDSGGAKRIRSALDREWRQHHGETPPAPPRLWWKAST